MVTLAVEPLQKLSASNILRRISERDKSAFKDCIDIYGNFIWNLAQKFTASNEEAEAATQNIFIDIWRHTEESDDETKFVEEKLITIIAFRRLLKNLR